MKPGLAEFLERHAISGINAYGLAVIAGCVATAARIALNPMLGDSAPYVFQAIALLVVSCLGGYGPGLVCLALVLALGWVYIPPYGQPMGQKLANEVSTTIAGSVIWLVTAKMRMSLLQSIAAQREADFLSREMHHRINNLFAVVASMVTLSARDRPAAQDAMMELRGRVQSLSDAHDATISDIDLVSLKTLMSRLCAPYCKAGTGEPRVLIDGPDMDLPYGFTTPMSLIFHELATNAVKHGALGTADGTVRISWARADRTLNIRWEEVCLPRADNPAENGKVGFGTILLEASVAQLRGCLDRRMTDDGLVVRVAIPMTDADGKTFRSRKEQDSQGRWAPLRSSLSALQASRWYSRRKSAIRDSLS